MRKLFQIVTSILIIFMCDIFVCCKENNKDVDVIEEQKNTLAGTKWKYHYNMTIEEIDTFCSVWYSLWFGSTSVSLTFDITIVGSGNPIGQPSTTKYSYTVFDDQILFSPVEGKSNLVGYLNGNIITLYNASTNEKIGDFRKDN